MNSAAKNGAIYVQVHRQRDGHKTHEKQTQKDDTGAETWKHG